MESDSAVIYIPECEEEESSNTECLHKDIHLVCSVYTDFSGLWSVNILMKYIT